MEMLIGLGLAGALLGVWVSESLAGLLLGSILGLLLAWLHRQGRRIDMLEKRLSAIQQASLSTEEPVVEPVVEPASQLVNDDAGSTTGTEAEASSLVEVELPDLPADPWSDQAEPRAASRPPSSPPAWQQAITRFFTDGNVVVRVGLLLLFIGVAFLLKYASEHSLLPIELRLSAAALGGMALTGLGWYLRQRRRAYALLLQGGGLGLFYIVVFAATSLYGLLPPLLALMLMVTLVLLSVLLAWWQDSLSLAVFGLSGGFLAPVLASTGQGSHVMLFSYYALLNLAILGIAWRKSWRVLNLLGFVFTFIIGTAWGVMQYRPEDYASTQPFLIFFFLLYVAIAVLFALRQPVRLRGYVDAGLVFGVPIVGFALQSALVHRIEFGLAFSALSLGAFYLILASALWRRQIEGMRLLTEAFLALGVVFASLAIPLAVDGRWTAAAWALEGAALLWIGLRQQHLAPRVFGLLLQGGAGLAFLLTVWTPLDAPPLFNNAVLGMAMVAVAGLFSSYVLHAHASVLRRAEGMLSVLLLIWGSLWWLGMGLSEIERVADSQNILPFTLLFLTASMVPAQWLLRRLNWPQLAWPVLAILPLLWLLVLHAWEQHNLSPWSTGWGLLAWPLWLTVQYWGLSRLQHTLERPWLPRAHAATFWLLLLVGSIEWHYWLVQWLHAFSAWTLAGTVLLPFAALVILPPLSRRMERWGELYAGLALVPVAVVLLGWFVLASIHHGDPAPLGWLPLLNPLELLQLLLLLALALWARQDIVQTLIQRHAIPTALPWGILGLAAFLLLNSLLAHTVHHWGDVAWHGRALHQSMLLQTSLSVAWTITALVLSWWATRRGWRRLWFVAAGLLALVVLKLFFVDLAESGTVERIVSFIGVGLLMLLIGYLSPLPPHRNGEQA